MSRRSRARRMPCQLEERVSLSCLHQSADEVTSANLEHGSATFHIFCWLGALVDGIPLQRLLSTPTVAVVCLVNVTAAR